MYNEDGVWTSGCGQENMFTSIRANLYNLITSDDDAECINILESILKNLAGIKCQMEELQKERNDYRRRMMQAEIKNGKYEVKIKQLGGEVE